VFLSFSRNTFYEQDQKPFFTPRELLGQKVTYCCFSPQPCQNNGLEQIMKKYSSNADCRLEPEQKPSSEIELIKKQMKKNHRNTLILIGLSTTVILGSFLFLDNVFFQNDESPLNSKYFTENLKGDTMFTWKHWNLLDDQPVILTWLRTKTTVCYFLS